MSDAVDPEDRASQEGVLRFPTDFPIKILGLNDLAFEPQIVELVRAHAPDLDTTAVEVRQSSAGKYLSLTVTVRARSREQLDLIYLALTAHPLVKVVL
jgi:putative lipoic acid-binding regulatory protein